MTKLDTRSLILISAAVVINIVASQAITLLRLPLYMDAIGTVIVAILSGPFAGAIAGGLTTVISGIIFNPVAMAFTPVSIAIGLTAGMLARAGGFRSWWLAVLCGAVIGVQTTILATPIIVFVFGGVAGDGADFGAAYMLAIGTSLIKAVGFSNLGFSLIDKSFTGLVAFVVVNRLPLRISTSFRFFAHSKAWR
jgi:energy-coupling factor transport system substrate-specific component